MKLYLVIPCYNGEAVLSKASRRLKKKYTALMGVDKIPPDGRLRAGSGFVRESKYPSRR